MPNRKRYEVTCDMIGNPVPVVLGRVCQTASGMRSHVTVSGRPQKQKAQIKVLENLLETEHAIALFGCHYIPIEYVMNLLSLL